MDNILAVLLGLILPAIVSGIVWICRSGTLAREHTRSKADKAEVEKLHECLDQHSAGLNWIGSAVEKLADHQRVSLPPRPIVPERERE